MIVPVTLIGLVIIVWLQHTYMSDDMDKPLYRKIFNRIKLPVIYLCLVCIIYLLIQSSCSRRSIVKVKNILPEQKVFNNIPPF
jgi:hypothetical protein